MRKTRLKLFRLEDLPIIAVRLPYMLTIGRSMSRSSSGASEEGRDVAESQGAVSFDDGTFRETFRDGDVVFHDV